MNETANTPPQANSRKGPFWPEFVHTLATRPAKATGAQPLDSWNNAVRSTVSASRCLQLKDSFEWNQYVQVLLASCFNKFDAKNVPAIAWAASASPAVFQEKYSKELAGFWASLPARTLELVTHLSKAINTSAENNVLVHNAPTAANIGMLCSGDLNEHTYCAGGAMKVMGSRHFFEGAAWRNEEFVRMPEELRQEDSLTTALLLKLGAPSTVLAQMRKILETRGTPNSVEPSLRQVYATLEDGTEVLITPVPSVGMLSFALDSSAPTANHFPPKWSYSVGGSQPGNAGGLVASASGYFKVFEAGLPSTLIPSEADVLRNLFYPASLLRPLTKAQVEFLRKDTSAWPNSNKKAYLKPRIQALLDWTSEPLVAAIAHLAAHPEALQAPALRAKLAQTTSPYLALIAGDASKEILEDGARLLAAQFGRALQKFYGTSVLVNEHEVQLNAQCTEFIKALAADAGFIPFEAIVESAPTIEKEHAHA